jgi:hypothetical protein
MTQNLKADKPFDAVKQVNALLEAECLVADAYLLCHGMSYADGQLDDARYPEAAAGALRLLALALEKAHEILSESGSSIRRHFDVPYSCVKRSAV